MRKQKTFYRNSGDLLGADLTKALDYAVNIDKIFDVRGIVIRRSKLHSYDNFHTTIIINFN